MSEYDKIFNCLLEIKSSLGEVRGELTGVNQHLKELNSKTSKNTKDIDGIKTWRTKIKARTALLIGLPAFVFTVLSVVVLLKNW